MLILPGLAEARVVVVVVVVVEANLRQAGGEGKSGGCVHCFRTRSVQELSVPKMQSQQGMRGSQRPP